MRFYRSPSFAAVLTVLVALAAIVADVETFWP
jgi:hypothetical protein